jgi:hypothetical protein
MTLYVTILFFLLSPGVLLRLPAGGSLVAAALVHAVVFGIVYLFTHKLVWNQVKDLEQTDGFTSHMKKKEGFTSHMKKNMKY